MNNNAHSYNSRDPKISILHYLCHCMNKYGIYKSYLVPHNNINNFETNVNLNVNIADDSVIIDLKKDFVIYDQSIKGNPLNFLNVIRWLLCPPTEEYVLTYNDKDIILYYCYPFLHNWFDLTNNKYYPNNCYNIKYANDDSFVFSLFDLTLVNNINLKFRQNTLFSCNETYEISLQQSNYNIDKTVTQTNILKKELVDGKKIEDILINYKSFVNNDLYGFLNIIALNFDMETIVIKNKTIHKDDWQKKSEWMNGIKYGFEDISCKNNCNIDYENYNVKNIKKINDIISKYVNIDCTSFNEPIFSMTNINGIANNVTNMNLNLKQFSVELDFIIYNYDFDYQNLFDFNYGSYNIGPRLEINKFGDVGLVIGSSSEIFSGFNIKRISLNTIIKLLIVINNESLLININNEIIKFDITPQIYNVNNLMIAGGFNNDRLLTRGKIYNFKLYNYSVPVYENIILKIHPLYDYVQLDYPRIIFQNNCKKNTNCIYEIGITELSNITIYFNFKIVKNCDLFLLNNFKVKIQNNKILILLNNLLLFTTAVDYVKKYNFNMTFNYNNKIAMLKFNDETTQIYLNENSKISFNKIYCDAGVENICITNYDIINKLSFDTTNIDNIKNYFYTFGFVKINNLLIEDNESIIKAFEYNLNKYHKNNINDYLPCAVEYTEILNKIIFNENIHKILSKIFSDKYYYNGSDCKLYISDTNWHCDRKVNNLHIKVALYLDKLDESNGCLSVIPGSQNHGDIFNKILSKYTVPLFKGPGGFDKKFLSINDNEIPKINIKNDYGDIIIFNLGLYHSAFNNQVNKKMICMNFAQSYADNNDPEKIECINSDCYIIHNNKKNINYEEKISILDNNFYNYVKLTSQYNLYFKELIENNNNLDRYVRILHENKNMEELNEFVKNNVNTNTNKTDINIKLYNVEY